MTALLSATSRTSFQTEMVRRAAELHLRCWCFDEAFNVTIRPPEGDGRSDSPQEAVAAARRCKPNNKPILTSLAHGGHLLALPDPHGAVVAILDGCTTLVRDQLVQVLKNYHSDLHRAASDQRSIDGFNQQLSQSYEEISLLFRMATALSSSDDPCRVVQSLCEELREVLRYGWLAAMFAEAETVLAPLRGLILHSGKLPCVESEFAAHCRSVDLLTNRRVLTPDNNALAAGSGSEVIVERLMLGDVPIGALIAGNREGEDPDVSSGELQFVEATASFLGLFHQNALRFAEQRRQFLGTLNALTAAIDAKDPYTRGHSERVGLLASQLAAKVGFSSEDAEAVRVAGLLHDIGKIGVPEAVLTKPGRLTAQEFELVKRHPEAGYRILEVLPSMGFHLPGVLYHHEWWDGRGYPHQLRGEAIPMIGRILAFADAFDAMSSDRSYRAAMPRSRVLEEIRRSSGSQFDPQLVESFVTLDFSEFDRMLQQSANTSETRA